MPDPATGSATGAPELPTDLAKELAKHLKADRAAKKKHEAAASSTDSPKTETKGQNAVDAAEIEALNDPDTDVAVDDIVRQESDEVLASEDAARKPATPEPRGFWRKLGHFFAAWWRNKWARSITILLVLAALTATAVVPTARYFALNTLGVRSSASLTVIDVSTQLPLKNVSVSMGGKEVKTDAKGRARLTGLRLGHQTVTVRRIAFAPVRQHVTLGWGSNPLGDFVLTATGARYTITVRDFISGKPLSTAEADSGVAAAVADKNGLITLTLDANVDTNAIVDITISAQDHRSETISLNLATTESTATVLVPSGKEVFFSKQSGTRDVVSMDLDGKNRTTLLPGTGNENNNLSLAVDAAGKRAAVVSTRDDIRDSDGYRLSTLTLVDIANGVSTTLDHAEQIQLIDWVGTRLIYEQAIAGASASNPQRYRIISYDYVASARVQLATANQFNAVVSAAGMLYYGVSSTDPNAQAAFFRVRPDGTGRQTVLNKETWSAFRTDYRTLRLQTPDGWYQYELNGTPQKSAPATDFQSRIYASNGDHNLWAENRVGLGTLVNYTASNNKDTVLRAQAGLNYPIRWLNSDTVIYRVATAQEVADYALSLSGGEPKKIVDVTNSYGFSQTN